MEVLRPVLLILAGAVAASAAFFFGLDRSLPHWLHVWTREEPIALVIDTPSAEAGGCQVSYAIDNRMDQRVYLTVNAAPPPYEPYAYDVQTSRHPYATDNESEATTNESGVSLPESEVPSIAPTDDYSLGSPNDGGSDSDTSGASDYGAPAGYSSPGGYGGPPPGVTPGPYSGPPSANYPPPPPPARPGATLVRPGRYYVTSNEGACNDLAHTVTIKLHDVD